MAENEGCRGDGIFLCICQTPDVCKSPTIPVPYQIVARMSQSIRTAVNVRFKGSRAFHMDSRVTTVIGDEAGSGGGVVSGVNKGFCRPIRFSTTVRANGQHVVYHQGSTMWMNCGGPEGVGNTTGNVKFQGAMSSAPVDSSGTVAEGDALVAAETPAESSFLQSAGESLAGPEGVVGAAQQAYGLGTTDWENPGAVLGAVGGVAGVAGLGGLAEGANVAKTAYTAATTDWSNPGEAIGAAMGMGGAVLGGGGAMLTGSAPAAPSDGPDWNDGFS